MRDVVVVGGGIAGLSAAWRLRHRDVVLLEAADRLGGRMRSDRRGEYWLNYGAHLFPAPGSLVDRIATECGLETVPVSGSMMALAVGSTLLTSGRVETYPFRLPLSVGDRIAFARAGIKIRRAVARYHRAERRFDFEDRRTFREFLGPRCAEPEEISAGGGIALFALVWGGKGSLIARNLVGGSGELPRAMGEVLGGRVRTGATVRVIDRHGTDLLVRYDGGEERTRHVIVAAQAPHAAPLVAPIAERAADALSRLTYGAFLTVAVETNETSAMPYDDVYAMATPGRVFDMFTNQAHALRRGGRRLPGGSLMLFAGARGAAELMRRTDDEIVERFLADLAELYPQTRGVVVGATVQRWELGNVYARPGRGRLQPMLEGALGQDANVHLAGDYFAELGNLEAAAWTGLAAAERVETRLREVTHA